MVTIFCWVSTKQQQSNKRTPFIFFHSLVLQNVNIIITHALYLFCFFSSSVNARMCNNIYVCMCGITIHTEQMDLKIA